MGQAPRMQQQVQIKPTNDFFNPFPPMQIGDGITGPQFIASLGISRVEYGALLLMAHSPEMGVDEAITKATLIFDRCQEFAAEKIKAQKDAEEAARKEREQVETKTGLALPE